MFRERALERITSPEQLDRLVRVTSPRRWLALAGLLLVLAAVIVWSAVSTVPTKIDLSGYYVPEGGVRVVEAPASGTVAALDVAIGDHVVDGQTVGTIRAADGTVSPLRAPETGVVSEIDAQREAYVAAGERMALIEPVGWPLVVYTYVPANVAPGLRPGTPARVRFGAGIAGAYGYAKGRVAKVNRFPATRQRLEFILQDAGVARGIARQGARTEVVIVLDQSAKTRNGLVWGSGDGPPSALPSGLPAAVELIVGSHHPIDNVL